MPTSRTTVLQIIPELETGGAELSTIEIADAVVRAGGRAIVLSAGGRMADHLAAVGGELITFDAKTKNPLTMWRNARRIAEIARREDVSLIHARSRAPAWSALVAARRLKLPYVTTYHGAYNEKSKAKNLYNSVMARGDAVIANSKYTADLIKNRYGTPDTRITVIYRGVDVERFNPASVSTERVAALRKSWGIDDNVRIVLHAARLTPWKGQLQVVEAAARLGHHLDDICIALAGDSQGRADYVTEIEKRIAQGGLSGKVRLVGHVDDMPAAFAAAHVAFVGSIEPEAFGRAGAEAQAMGCPVISTNIGAPPETVLAAPRVSRDQRTGWLVPPGDLNAYTQALEDALSLSDEERRAMAARARQHIIANFTATTMQHATLNLYDRLLGTKLVETSGLKP